VLGGLALQLSVQNVFDKDPPFVAAIPSSVARYAGYDPANANPLGRFMALEVRKAF
jgi:outer membrane receptor protein involved in Fe transport